MTWLACGSAVEGHDDVFQGSAGGVSNGYHACGHEFDDVDTKVLVDHRAQADACAREPL